MMNEIKKIYRRIKSKTSLFSKFKHNSYSQEGEDLVLARYFEHKENGFYVDIGAHHPFRFSNTYFFYKKGWRGINVDATPNSMRLFKKYRKNDVNLELAVSDSKKELILYCMNDGALNTFSFSLAKEREKLGYKIVKEVKINSLPLCEIFEKYLINSIKIDFLSIDVEGEDLNVLKSNDWEKFRPEIVLAEVLSTDLLLSQNSEVHKYLSGQGYALLSKTVNTYFYKDVKNANIIQ